MAQTHGPPNWDLGLLTSAQGSPVNRPHCFQKHGSDTLAAPWTLPGSFRPIPGKPGPCTETATWKASTRVDLSSPQALSLCPSGAIPARGLLGGSSPLWPGPAGRDGAQTATSRKVSLPPVFPGKPRAL